MRQSAPRYPVDRYLVESSNKFEMVSMIDDEIWNPEPALRPEDEIILRKLHDMLQSTADDLKLLSGELSKFHEPGVQVKSVPTPLDEDFNEKVHIEEVVNAKFHGYKIIEKPLHKPEPKPRNDTIDGVKVNQTKIVNTDVKANVTQVFKRPVINKKLGISRTRIVQINGKNQDSVKSEKLNNGKVINSIPAVAYNEFSFKYVEPKVTETPRKCLQIQDMPSISIRSELKQQHVLQLDIVPESKLETEASTTRSNVSVVTITHDKVLKAPMQSTAKLNETVLYPSTTVYNKKPLRKISKMSTCESSGGSTNNDSDARAKQATQKRIISAMRSSPKNSARDRTKKNNTVRKETDKRRVNVEEWKKKLNAVYGSSSTKKTQAPLKKSSPKKSNVTLKRTLLNNAEYIPYSQLTLGGVRVSDIEREISNLPHNTDMPLSPILDKILSSRENSFSKNSPRRHLKNSPKILTTSDENLLQEVLDIERSVSDTLSKNLKNKVNEPVIKIQNVSKESNSVEENESYADDFEEEKSDHSDNSGAGASPSEIEKLIISNQNKKDNVSVDDDDDDDIISDRDPRPGPSLNRNTTYTKTINLSFKDSIDVFEFVHSVDTQEIATQSNDTNKITPKETQTSPRNDRSNLQPIHNDLWPSIDPRQEVEKMFELEKDFIKKLIIDEYGDLLEKNINKPSTSNDNKTEDRKNVAAAQKNTQTSPAHVKSVMTSPKTTKTRTTSPMNLSVPVQQQTSPMICVTNEEEQRICVGIEVDDISVNLSSPRFSLRLPQNSHEVISNLENQSNSRSKPSAKNKLSNHNKTFTKTTASSSSSLDADNSSTEMSSLGEIKVRRKIRKRIPSSSNYSSTSTVSKSSVDLHSVGILPLRSEGEVSLEQAIRRRLQKPLKSEGETSFP